MKGTYDVMEQIALDRPAFDAEAHERVTVREGGFENGDGDDGRVRVGMIGNLGIRPRNVTVLVTRI